MFTKRNLFVCLFIKRAASNLLNPIHLRNLNDIFSSVKFHHLLLYHHVILERHVSYPLINTKEFRKQVIVNWKIFEVIITLKVSFYYFSSVELKTESLTTLIGHLVEKLPKSVNPFNTICIKKSLPFRFFIWSQIFTERSNAVIFSSFAVFCMFIENCTLKCIRKFVVIGLLGT